MDRKKPTIALVSTIDPSSSDTHWASPYYALKRAFQSSSEYNELLVDSTEIADIVIICPRLRNPKFPAEIIFNRNTFSNYEKTIIFSTDDDPFLTHPGIYTSIERFKKDTDLFIGGFYPHVAFNDELETCLGITPSNLFSFRGDIETHSVRQEMAHYASTEWKSLAASRNFSFRFENIKSPSLDPLVSKDDYKKKYLSAIGDSKFILCPRGRCPSSIRMFEAIRAGRVPVVISDEWVSSKLTPMKDFIIEIPYSQVRNIPEILLSLENSFSERSAKARSYWLNHLSKETLPGSIVLIAEKIQKERINKQYILFCDLARQLGMWRFWRQGVLSFLFQTFKEYCNFSQRLMK